MNKADFTAREMFCLRVAMQYYKGALENVPGAIKNVKEDLVAMNCPYEPLRSNETDKLCDKLKEALGVCHDPS